MNRKNNVDIKFSDIIWRVIIHWRIIPVCVVICMLLCVSLKYISDCKKYKEYMNAQGTTTVMEQESSLSELLSEGQVEQVKSAYEYRQKYDQRVKYYQESMLMNVDPYNLSKLSMQLYLTSEKATDPLLNEYRLYFTSGKLAQDLKKELSLELEEQYINELLTCSNSSYILYINFVYDDEEVLKKAEKALCKLVKEYEKEISASLYANTLTIASSEIVKGVDTIILNQQQTAIDLMENHRSKTVSLMSTFNEYQQKYYELLCDGMDDEEALDQKTVVLVSEETDEDIVPKPSISVLNTIIGFLIGIFLVLVWNVIAYIFALTIQSESETNLKNDLRKLGTVICPDRVKEDGKFGSKIDARIYKLRKKNQWMVPIEQQIDKICANIQIYCEKNDIKTLWLDGVYDYTLEPINQIRQKLKIDGIDTLTSESINQNADDLRKAARDKHIVFVEKIGSTVSSAISEDIMLAQDNDMNIIGYICID